MTAEFTDEMHDAAKAAWGAYLDLIEPLRPALARYCRRLTGDVWDAEDLANDTLLRGFALLGSTFHRIARPESYLLRIATNRWIDSERRRALEAAILGDPAIAPAEATPAGQEDAAQVRDAGAVLMRYLAPQERAAVLLKDVFDMSLAETASILGTTDGAVKSALSRGRRRLQETGRAVERPAPSGAVVDAFVERFNARDREGLLALMLDTAPLEMSGINNEFGREGFERQNGWFARTLAQVHARWERRDFRGEPLILQLTRVRGQDVATSVIRLETEDDHVARLRCYTFCPLAIAEVASELGASLGPVFYSFRPFFEAWADPANAP